MSAKQIGLVWEIDLPHNEAWVLMALADHADHEGRNAFPGVQLLAWKTGYSERNVERCLASLEKKRIISPVTDKKGGRGRTVNYEIHAKNGKQKAAYVKQTPTKRHPSSRRNPDKMTGFEPSQKTKKEVAAAKKDDKRGNSTAGGATSTETPTNCRPFDFRNGDKMSGLDGAKRVTFPTGNPDNAGMKTPTGLVENPDNTGNSHDKERARINRHEPSCEPSGERTRARDDADSLSPQFSPVEFALCAAVGWIPDVLSHSDYFAVKEAARQIAAYETATPERIVRASEFYRSQRKYSYHVRWISRDWSQIDAWIDLMERGEEGSYGSNRPRQTHNARAAEDTVAIIEEAFFERDRDYDLDPIDAAPERPAIDNREG